LTPDPDPESKICEKPNPNHFSILAVAGVYAVISLEIRDNCSAGSGSKSGNMVQAWKLKESIATIHL